MNTKHQLQPSALVAYFTGIIALLLFLQVAFRAHYSRQYNLLVERASGQKAAKVIANWTSLAYTNRSSTSHLDAVVLSNLDWTTLPLDDGRKQKLRLRLSEILSYMEEPSFQSYFSLKANGVTYEFSLNTNLLPVLGSQAGMLTGRADVEGLVSNAWMKVSGLQSRKTLTGVCVQSVRHAVSPDGSIPGLLKSKAGLQFLTLQTFLDPGFHYSLEDQSASRVFVSPVFYHLGFIGRFDPTGVSPFFVTLEWSEKDQQWLLVRFGADSSLGMKTLS
jgi:hypothetical protein